MAAKQDSLLLKKHSQSDLVSRLKSRRILGVGVKDADGEFHRSKISQMLGNEFKFAFHEPFGLRHWQFISALAFSAVGILALAFPRTVHGWLSQEEHSQSCAVTLRFHGGALLSRFLLVNPNLNRTMLFNPVLAFPGPHPVMAVTDKTPTTTPGQDEETGSIKVEGGMEERKAPRTASSCISLILWNAVYTTEKVIVRWALLAQTCYFAVGFLVVLITSVDQDAISQGAAVLLSGFGLFGIFSLFYYVLVGRKPKKI